MDEIRFSLLVQKFIEELEVIRDEYKTALRLDLERDYLKFNKIFS